MENKETQKEEIKERLLNARVVAIDQYNRGKINRFILVAGTISLALGAFMSNLYAKSLFFFVGLLGLGYLGVTEHKYLCYLNERYEIEDPAQANPLSALNNFNKE